MSLLPFAQPEGPLTGVAGAEQGAGRRAAPCSGSARRPRRISGLHWSAQVGGERPPT
jgi:hypothetical protein